MFGGPRLQRGVAAASTVSEPRDGLYSVPANKVLAEIHNSGALAHRMPAIPTAQDRAVGLTGTPDEGHAVLRQYAGEHTASGPTGTRENKPAVNDAKLIEAIA